MDDSAFLLYLSVPVVYFYPNRFVLGVPSLVRAGSSYVACAPTMPASSLLTVGRKITNHPTSPTLQRSCSNWGHPASYFFTGDPAAFRGFFAFLVGGNSTWIRSIPNLRSPAAVHHRALCPYLPSTVQLGPRDLGSLPQLVGLSRDQCPPCLHVQDTGPYRSGVDL